MRRDTLLISVLAGVTMSVVAAASAQAQATRTWVSGVGDDANPCSRTAPCKTFPGAISKTAAGGEINCLDPGGFGGVTITKSIAIYCDGTVGGVVVSGTNAIVVNAAATDVVVLRGLDINGLGTGLNGISFLAGAALHVEKSQIRNFRGGSPNGHGIRFFPSTANAELYVTDTTISNNGAAAGTGGGIAIGGTGSSKVVLTNVRSENNLSVGFRADSTTASTTMNITISGSSFVGNAVNGVVANAPGGTGAVQVLIDHSDISHNVGTGIRGDGSAATVRIANTNIAGNGLGSQFTNSAAFASYGNSHIDGNMNNGLNPGIIPQR